MHLSQSSTPSDGVTEEVLNEFYSDHGTVDATVLETQLTLGSQPINIFDSNVPEEIMDGGPSIETNDLPPHVAEIRKALVDGEAPASLVLYVVKAVNTYEWWIRDLWKAAKEDKLIDAACKTDSTNAESKTVYQNGSTVEQLESPNSKYKESLKIHCPPCNQDSYRSSTRVSTASLHHLEKRLQVLQQCLASNNHTSDTPAILLRSCLKEITVLRQQSSPIPQNGASCLPPKAPAPEQCISRPLFLEKPHCKVITAASPIKNRVFTSFPKRSTYSSTSRASKPSFHWCCSCC